jgi:acyl carrier protein
MVIGMNNGRALKIIINEINKLTQVDKITMNSSLESLGINSISFIKLIVAIENELGFEFEYEHLNMKKYLIINDLVQYVAGRIGD